MTRRDYRLIAEGVRNAPESVLDELCFTLRNACPSFNEDKFRAFCLKAGGRKDAE